METILDLFFEVVGVVASHIEAREAAADLDRISGEDPEILSKMALMDE